MKWADRHVKWSNTNKDKTCRPPRHFTDIYWHPLWAATALSYLLVASSKWQSVSVSVSDVALHSFKGLLRRDHSPVNFYRIGQFSLILNSSWFNTSSSSWFVTCQRNSKYERQTVRRQQNWPCGSAARNSNSYKLLWEHLSADTWDTKLISERQDRAGCGQLEFKEINAWHCHLVVGCGVAATHHITQPAM